MKIQGELKGKVSRAAAMQECVFGLLELVFCTSRKLNKRAVWRAENRERIRAYDRERYVRNNDKLRKWARHRQPEVRLERIARRCLKYYGFTVGNQLESIIGISFAGLRRHIESQWKDGMTWDNFGIAWEIDHIKPRITYGRTLEGQSRALHYTNWQPLWDWEHKEKTRRERWFREY
jgi:hypothetical protein